MDCRIVNRRGKTLRLFVGKLPTKNALEVLRIRGWEEWPGTHGFGEPSDPYSTYYYPYGTGYLLDQDVGDGVTVSVQMPDEGTLFYLRGAVLVGPWFLVPPENTEWHPPYRSNETRLVIVGGVTDSGMVKGIDGIIRHVESQYRGRIPPVFAPTAGPDPTRPPVDAETVILMIARNLISGVAGMSAAFGNPGGRMFGALLTSGSGLMLGVLNVGPEQRKDQLDLAEMTMRFQALFDDNDARTAATTIAATQNQLAFHRQQVLEATLLGSQFTQAERKLYFDWHGGAALDAGATAQLQAVKEKLAAIFAAPDWRLADAERRKFAEFVHGALDTDAHGSFAWSMLYLMRNPAVMRMVLPDYLLGIGLHATIAEEGIALDLADGMTETPVLYRSVATQLDAFTRGARGTIDAILGEMRDVISSNGLKSVPERIEILRYYSEHFFGSPDTLRDAELPRDIPRPATSFGADRPELWDEAATYGPLIDVVFTQGAVAVAALNAKAGTLEG